MFRTLPMAEKTMMEYSAFAVALVENGKLKLSDHQRKSLNAKLRSLEGKYARVSIRQEGKVRSLNQNAYLWGVVYSMISAESGHTTEEVHEYMKATFLPRHFIRLGDSRKEQQIGKSTTTLTTTEFEEYLQRIRAFAAQELNLVIPLPHETV